MNHPERVSEAANTADAAVRVQARQPNVPVDELRRLTPDLFGGSGILRDTPTVGNERWWWLDTPYRNRGWRLYGLVRTYGGDAATMPEVTRYLEGPTLWFHREDSKQDVYWVKYGLKRQPSGAGYLPLHVSPAPQGLDTMVLTCSYATEEQNRQEPKRTTMTEESCRWEQ